MRVLFIGDIYGKPGRRAVREHAPSLRKRHQRDAVVANCENAASGKGVTPEIARSLLGCGVDVLTGGNHIWQYRDIIPFLEESPQLIRPANYPEAPGVGITSVTLPGGELLVVMQVEGRVFIHAEATSEKQALGWHLDGRVSAVLGTHTHVPTADERILPGGTAFQTDTGMTGPYDSVIGMKAEAALSGFLTQRRSRHQVATGNTWLCGAVIEIDPRTGKSISIERIKEVMDD